jgi:hypothetical protein
MGAAKGLRTRFRETPVKDLALRHQILDRAGDILDRHLWIDTVLIDQVDTIGSQAPQHALDRPLDMIRPAVRPLGALACLQVDVHAEFGLEDHLVAHTLQRLSDDLFGNERSVGLGRVDQRHALIDRPPDQVDRDIAVDGAAVEVRHGALGRAGQPLATEPDGRDFERAEHPGRGRWHGVGKLGTGRSLC